MLGELKPEQCHILALHGPSGIEIPVDCTLAEGTNFDNDPISYFWSAVEKSIQDRFHQYQEDPSRVIIPLVRGEEKWRMKRFLTFDSPYDLKSIISEGFSLISSGCSETSFHTILTIVQNIITQSSDTVSRSIYPSHEHALLTMAIQRLTPIWKDGTGLSIRTSPQEEERWLTSVYYPISQHIRPYANCDRKFDLYWQV